MKYVVISSNLNDDYLFYIPIVSWAWQKLGWNIIFLSPHYNSEKYKYVRSFLKTESVLEWSANSFDYREETICQVSRLYVANESPDEHDLILTSDADMLPLSDYWQPNPNDITCYGTDLSDVHIPICYVCMKVYLWKHIMDLTGDFISDIKRDLSVRQDVVSDDKEKWWIVDQELLTEKLKNKAIKKVERGTYTHSGYAVGRVDRSSWIRSQQQPERIDCHLLRQGYLQENWEKIMSIIKECFSPSVEEISYLNDYRKNYLKYL